MYGTEVDYAGTRPDSASTGVTQTTAAGLDWGKYATEMIAEGPRWPRPYCCPALTVAMLLPG
eukprot:3940757-Rhodomonas_salina.2